MTTDDLPAGFQPWALDITTSSDVAFDLADTLGMEGVMTALSVTIFDAPDGKMLVQALYDTEAGAKTALKTLPDTQAALAVISQLPAKDWVSETQAGLPPVHAGRFYVYGSHEADNIPADLIPIHVDAGMAFGTGHHGTTAGCLRIFSQLLDRENNPSTVLDLGCGAGILAIAAAKTLPNADILATDIDPDAIEVTNHNAVQNDVSGRIGAHVADGFGHAVLQDRQFNLIFANILAGPLMELANDIVAATAPDGFVILSGILDEKAAQVAECFKAAGLDVTPQPSLEGWTSILGYRPK